MDFITGLPSSSGNTVILTIMDHFSKMVHLVPLKKLPSAKERGGIMVKEVFHLHGILVDIVSDRDPQFISHFWREFCNFLGILICLSLGFHPHGQSDKANQEVETKLRLLCEGYPNKWAVNLPWVEHAINSIRIRFVSLSFCIWLPTSSFFPFRPKKPRSPLPSRFELPT